MAVFALKKTVPDSANTQRDTASSSIRDVFQDWLVADSKAKYLPEAILSCIDKISEYAVRKKIAAVSLWEYTHYNAFNPIYKKLIEAKFLRIIDRNTYKVFIVAGQLYLQFLKEKPFGRKEAIPVASDENEAKPAIEPISTSNIAIDPEDVIAWLVTQPNANGSLYLENVVRQYMRIIRTIPSKLEISVTADIKSVFTCRTPDELAAYWNIFRAAPNYKQVNSSTSGMFSAGLSCYMRYLQHITKISNAENMNLDQIVSSQSLPVDFWNDHIKTSFQSWLVTDANYSPKTAQIYACAVSRTIRSYHRIVDTATHEADNQAHAVKKFIALLGEDSIFIEANAKRHNQLKAALSVFERFVFLRANDILETGQYTADKSHESYWLFSDPLKDTDPLIIEQLTDVLSTHFSNGYRLNSLIEMKRFRTFAKEAFGKELILSDEELKSHIVTCGTMYEGKVYVVSTETKERIKRLAKDYFTSGAQVIFYTDFYAKNESWLFEAGIVSGIC